MRYQFAQHGIIFSTRERGAVLRAEIEETAARVPADEPVVLDFESVELLSFSFADEVVGRILEEPTSDRSVVLANLNEDVAHPIERSLERRQLVAAELRVDGLRLMNAAPHLQETLDAACRRGEFRASELAEDLDLGLPACNNRLQALLDARLLVRTRAAPPSHGREFVYRVPAFVREALLQPA